MDLSTTQILEWLFLVSVIGFLIYTMFVIKREKQTYLENPSHHSLENFELLTPNWWTAIEEKPNYLQFERTDSRYDWKAKFEWTPLPLDNEDDERSIEEVFRQKVANQNILFDKDFTIIHNPSGLQEQFLYNFEHWEVVRIEGTATKDAESRLYFDAYLIKDKKRRGYLYCESISSVLNGLVEGPYFEEVVKRLKPIDSSYEKKV